MRFLCSRFVDLELREPEGWFVPAVVQGFQRGDLTPLQCRTAALVGCDHSHVWKDMLTACNLYSVFWGVGALSKRRCPGDVVALSKTQPWYQAVHPSAYSAV